MLSPSSFDATDGGDPFLMEIIGNEGSRDEDPSIFCYQDDIPRDYDPSSPAEICTSVDFLLRTWTSSIQFQPIAPDLFLSNLMISRGYQPILRPSLLTSHRRVPSVKQIEDYDNDLIHAVRNSDLSKIADHYR